jgi:hypothetical protein
MPTILERVSNAYAQGTRWRATPNAHQGKDQTFKISERTEERTRPEWLIFTAVKWLSFKALQRRDFLPRQPFGLSALGEAATSAARRDSSPKGVPVCRLTNFDFSTRSATYKGAEKVLVGRIAATPILGGLHH